jgi:hypothetical protein
MNDFKRVFRGRVARGAVMLSLGLGVFGGCVGSDPQEAPVDIQANVVASVQLANGTVVNFHEPEPGQIIVVANGDMPATQRQMSAVALYESLTTHAAPTALIEAQQRADRAPHRDPTAVTEPAIVVQEARPDLPPTEVRDGIGRATEALTAAQFQSGYCGGGPFSVFYCRTNRTGNTTIDFTATNATTNVNAYRGRLIHTMYYKNSWGNWILLWSMSVTGDTFVSQWPVGGSHHQYRFTTTEAENDGYHYSIRGI